jgi:hypothetical protein
MSATANITIIVDHLVIAGTDWLTVAPASQVPTSRNCCRVSWQLPNRTHRQATTSR